MLYSHIINILIYTYTCSCRIHTDAMNNDERRLLYKNMYLSLYCKGSKRVTLGFTVRGSWRPNKDCNILTPTLMTVSVVSFSFSRSAQLEAQGPSSLLDDGFLYCILSPTGLQNSIRGPEAPFGRVWLSLPHLVSDVSDPQLDRGPREPLRPCVAFPTTPRL